MTDDSREETGEPAEFSPKEMRPEDRSSSLRERAQQLFARLRDRVVRVFVNRRAGDVQVRHFVVQEADE